MTAQFSERFKRNCALKCNEREEKNVLVSYLGVLTKKKVLIIVCHHGFGCCFVWYIQRPSGRGSLR